MELPIWKLQRYRIMGLLVFVNIICYMVRFSINIAILDMVEKHNSTIANNGSCRTDGGNRPNNSFSIQSKYLTDAREQTRFSWTEEEQGLLLACFFYGYTVSVGILGLAADIIGARYLIGLSLTVSSFLALFYELFAKWGFGYLVALRTLQGAVQGGMFPPQTSLWGRWAPKDERTTMLGVTNTVALLGNVISNALTAIICQYIGWPWVFYIYGGVGMIFGILWIAFVRNTPAEMSWISAVELDYIQKHAGFAGTKLDLKKVPFKSIVTSVPFWAICYSGVTGSVLMFTVIDMVPKYLSDVHDYHLISDGFLSGLPFIANFTIGALACILVDVIQRKKLSTATTTRKVLSVSAMVPCVVLLCLISTCGCDSTAIVIIICIVNGIAGLNTATYTPSLVDMAPNYGGILHGIADTVYSASGFIVPMISSAVIADDPYLIASWSPLWYMCAGIIVSGAISFALFATSEEQDWNKIENESYENLVNS